MDLNLFALSYIDAWNRKDVSEILRMMHPKASYYDAFWQEACTGTHLSKYFSTNFITDTHWYRGDEDIVLTPNGIANRYLAFDLSDPDGLNPLYNGVEIITMRDGLILTISDHYCDPNPANLVAIANLAEGWHFQASPVEKGLSARSSLVLQRRLTELAREMTVFLDPSLTMTKLAEQVDCSVKHLFHVLEEEKGTTFLQYVDECRVRYASTLLVDSGREIRFDQISKECGFDSIAQFRNAFQSTFGMSADEYLEKFAPP